ncbi:MAG: HPr family phosphocarrier protein [Myxococcales bacterium]|nr:HPr family phosphocarrier protein [Myxococcales bacterium]
MSVLRSTFQIKNKLGLHARAATKLVQVASRYRCEVTLSRAGQSANAKSVMGVLLLCGSQGSNIDVEANGEGAAEVIAEIGKLIDDRFGEGE